MLVGKPAGSDGETSIYGYTAQLHVVEIEAVLKGEPEPGQLRIASMPATCTRMGCPILTAIRSTGVEGC